MESDRVRKLVPLGDKVVIRPLEAEEKTSGGIVLPDSAREKPREGRVLSVGDGMLLADGSRSPHEVSEGDRVIYGKWSGTEVKLNGDDLLIMKESDIMGIIE